MKVWLHKWLWHPYRLVFCVLNDLRNTRGLTKIYNEGGNVPLKSTVNTVLPIAMAIILPGLSLYTNPEVELSSNYVFFIGWLGASTFMYLNWYVLWFLWDIRANPQRRPLLLLMIIGMVGLVGSFLYLALDSGHELRDFNFIRRTLLSVILFLAIQYALKSQERISRLLLEKEQIQTENYRAQLKVLQAQIDPHFLFNSLNTLRSMVRQQHGNSEKFIMSLSDFYRQTLKHNQNTTLSLSQELAVLQSYLFLMKSRNEEAIQIKLNIDEALHDKQIPTLALQVVVENCFKHNSMSSKRPLSIQIETTDDQYILVRNNVQPKLGDEESSGYGLSFLRKRYELMDIAAGIIVEESVDEFSIKLKLI